MKEKVIMERLSKLASFLLLLVPGLLAFLFFVKIPLPREGSNLIWLMVLLFHVPILLFLIAAFRMEIIERTERRDRRLLSKK